MERLIKHLYIFCGLVATIAAAVHLTPAPDRSRVIPEEDLAQMMPEKVKGGRFIPESPGKSYTYRMDEQSYEILQWPSAVCRVYQIGKDELDVVLLASRSKDAFHDPNICFAAQGWFIERREQTTLNTKTRGQIPVTIISMYNDDVRRKMAAYLYKGPTGLYSDTNKLKLSFLREELFLGDRLEGVFYRFIPTFENREMTEAQQREQLEAMIIDFMDNVHATSEGYL